MNIFSNISKPSFIVDLNIVKNNIRTMKSRLPEDVSLRPHFKTHDNIEIGHFLKSLGIEKITVSSYEMAEKFANIGFSDITIAFPLNFHELNQILNLAKHVKINISISSFTAGSQLQKKTINNELGFFIEIDTGYKRSGIFWKNKIEIRKTLDILNLVPNLHFKGFFTHNGSTYQAKNRDEIKELSISSNNKMLELKQEFSDFNPKISVGDTPGCCIINNFTGIDEVRPGNFVYFDLMQSEIGVCEPSDIAVRMICPVVDVNTDRNEIVIYGGAVHFSKESLIIDGRHIFGKAVKIHGNRTFDTTSYLTALSQEHGIIRISDLETNQIKPGDRIEIIPVHSCLTANLMKRNTIII